MKKTIDELVKDPDVVAAKKTVMQAYKDTPGFSGIGIEVPPEGEKAGLMVLFYENIPDNFITKINGVNVRAKIAGPTKKQPVMAEWGDYIDDIRGLT